MKKLLFFCLWLLFLQPSGAQPYQRIRLEASPQNLLALQELALTDEHLYKAGHTLQLELSIQDVQRLREKQLAYEVLVEDLEAYYAQRIKQDQAKPSASGACRPSKVTTPAHFHLGSMGGSFTLQEMIQQLDSMALLFPSLITGKQAISSTLSIEGRTIWYVKISDNPNLDENEPEVLYTALHHAREGGSLSELIFFMWYLLENYTSDPAIQALVDNRELYFVPCLNPDGYYFNEQQNPAGGGMWRKNRRVNADNTFGVDLNRNYGFNWGFNNQGSSPNPSSDTYRGTAPFSEPETQAMKDFCDSRNFTAALNAHTFGNFLITPWGFQTQGNTPDSSRFTEWGDYLTRENRYYHGSSMQTVNYAVNGNSDDWMYGEQVSKAKIMAMTPEMGSPNDGFWPMPSRIEDICKSALEQNLRLARLAGQHVAFIDEQDQFVLPNSYIHYALKDLGLQPGSATLSLQGLQGLASFGPTKTYTFASGQVVNDSMAFTLSPGFQPGQMLRYAVQINDGVLLFRDTIEKVLGPAATLFYSNGNASPALVSSSWGNSLQQFFSPPSSWTDSPFGPYQSGASDHLALAGPVSLQQTQRPHLQFRFRYDIEKSYDDVRVLISTNQGQSYSPLCGKYSSPDYTYGGLLPIYDGRQAGWVKEEIDLSPYIGSNIWLRWQLNSDFFDERDGIYLDEIKIRAIGGNPTSIEPESGYSNSLRVVPNPTDHLVHLITTGKASGRCLVYNLQGSLCLNASFESDETPVLDVSALPPGIYILRWESEKSCETLKLVKE